MALESAAEQFRAGKRLLKDSNIERALKAFEKAYKEDKARPEYMSYYGLCKAIKGEIGLGLELCTRAIKEDFSKPDFYLNLAKVYLAAGNKKGALKVIQKGLKFDPNSEEMNKILVELGFRAKSVIPGLNRSNPVNKYLGILIRRVIPELLKKKS